MFLQGSIKNNIPLVSIITVVYNDRNKISETVKSVISQSYDSIEYIIIDGASNDGTLDEINKFKDKVSIIISEKDKGIYDAMNKGISISNGDFIMFLNSGDILLSKNVIEEYILEIKKYDPSINIFYSSIQIIHKGLKKFLSPQNKIRLLFSMPFCHQSVLCRTSYMKSHLFSEKYKLAADYLFFRTAYIEKEHLEFINVISTQYDLSGISYSRFNSYFNEMRSIILKTSKHSIHSYFSLIAQYSINIPYFLLRFKNLFFRL